MEGDGGVAHAGGGHVALRIHHGHVLVTGGVGGGVGSLHALRQQLEALAKGAQGVRGVVEGDIVDAGTLLGVARLVGVGGLIGGVVGAVGHRRLGIAFPAVVAGSIVPGGVVAAAGGQGQRHGQRQQQSNESFHGIYLQYPFQSYASVFIQRVPSRSRGHCPMKMMLSSFWKFSTL